MIDRSDGEGVITGYHTMVRQPLFFLPPKIFQGLANLGLDLGRLEADFGTEFGEKLGHHMEHLSSSSSSSFSPSFSSASLFSSSNMGNLGAFDPFSVFGTVRRKWYQVREGREDRLGPG